MMDISIYCILFFIILIGIYMLNKILLNNANKEYQINITGFVEYYGTLEIDFYNNFSIDGLEKSFYLNSYSPISESFTTKNKELWIYSEHYEQSTHPITVELNSSNIPTETGRWNLNNKTYRVRFKITLTQSKNNLELNV